MNRTGFTMRLNQIRINLLACKIPNSIQLFLYLTTSHFSLATLVYYLLRLILPNGWVFGAIYRMPCYHCEFPAQYIALVVIVHSAILTILFVSESNRSLSLISNLVIMVLTILIASPLGGLLWVYHDMELGFYPTGGLLLSSILSAVFEGLSFGWLVILLSIPYNLIGIIVGHKTINYALSTFRRDPKYLKKR